MSHQQLFGFKISPPEALRFQKAQVLGGERGVFKRRTPRIATGCRSRDIFCENALPRTAYKIFDFVTALPRTDRKSL